jgi:hypothetical protein
MPCTLLFTCEAITDYTAGAATAPEVVPQMFSRKKPLKFMLVPMLLIPVAVIVIAMTPRQSKQREAPEAAAQSVAVAAAPTPTPTPETIATPEASPVLHPGDLVAIYRSDTGSSAELRVGRSAACDAMFRLVKSEAHRWQVAREADYGNHAKSACWRTYESNEKMWDGKRAPWPAIALCLPGACISLPSSAFVFAP